MRIIGGEFRGRKFYPPADKWPTRPTTDFAKEGLFNILTNRLDFEELKVLDIFGGTGNHSYEFISRGCRDVTYVDRFAPAVAFAKKISQELGIEAYISILRADALKFIAGDMGTYDYIFAGPPYGMPQLDSIPDRVMGSNRLAQKGLFVLEHNPKHNFEDHPDFLEMRSYGKTLFSFFRHHNPESKA